MIEPAPSEIERACADVRAAPDLERFVAVEHAAYRLGRAVAVGELLEAAVLDALLGASGLCGTSSEVKCRRAASRSLARAVRKALGAIPPAPVLRLVPPGEVEPAVRPTILLGTDLLRIGDEAAAAMASDPSFFQRRGRLVHVVRVAATEAEADAARPEGTPEIHELAPPTLRERLSSLARWERFDSRTDEWKPAMPPMDVVQAISLRRSWRRMRPLVGVTETPLVRPDGTILQKPGYDAATGYLYSPEVQFPAIEERPTQHDAMLDLAALGEVFCDFPFRGEADRMVPVAALLTLIARPAIAGPVPAFVFDASTPGSGKSRMADSVAIIATSRPFPRGILPTKPEELEKVIFAAALAARPIFGLDNIDAPLQGGPLDAVLTGEEYEGRYLGRSELVILPWRAVALVTGNNVVIKGDTQRRSLLARLEPREERPEDRTDFRHPNLLAWVREHRTRLVCAALRLLRAYAAAGFPDQGIKPWGSFEEWCRVVPSAIAWAGGQNVLDARLSATGDVDPERGALSALVRLWPRLDVGSVGITLRSALATLYPAADRGGSQHGGPPDGFEDLRDAIEVLCPPKAGGVPDGARLGYAFRRLRGRWVAGGKLDAVQDRTGTLRWRIAADASPPTKGVDRL